jgi:hypothetical protein
MKRLLLASVLMLPAVAAHADEFLTFPYCVNTERLHNVCKVEGDGEPLVYLSPAEWKQMERLHNRALDILDRALDRISNAQKPAAPQ